MSTWLWWLGQNTITVALMLPFVLLACRLFRNRPAVQHVLWVVVLLKFLTPLIVSWPWTVEQMAEAIWPTPASGFVEQATPSPSAPERLERSNITSVPEIHPDPVLADVSVDANPTASTSAKQSEPGVAPFFESRSTGTYFPVQAIAGIWLLCVIMAGVVQLRRIARHAAFVRRGTTAPAQLTTEIKAAAQRLGMKPPRAVLARGILSPFVWCLGCLRLVWPEVLANASAIARSRGIIAHELSHIRRRDHWVAWLELVAGVVWWWNPLYWYVRRRLRETAEMACDALAVATIPENRREYAQVLLDLSAGFKNGAPPPVLAVGAGTPSSFERRLSMILSERVSGKLSGYGIVAALGFALVALPGWSMAGSDMEDLQGTWYVIAMEEGGQPQPKDRFEDVKMRLVVNGDKLAIMTTTPDGRDVGQQGVTFKLDEKGSPKQLDASKDGRTLLGIYAFEKGQLKLCIDLEGKNRPTSFKTEAGRGQRFYILQKKGPPGQDDKKAPQKQDKEKNVFTAWGKEVGGLQAGLGYKTGQKRAYSQGETVKVVLRVRNVGKEAVDFKYIGAFFVENPPKIRDANGIIVQLPNYRTRDQGLHMPRSINVMPGKEVELYEWSFDLQSNEENSSRSFIHGTGKYSLQSERIVGATWLNPDHPNPILSKLATGKLELEIKSTPSADKKPTKTGNDQPLRIAATFPGGDGSPPPGQSGGGNKTTDDPDVENLQGVWEPVLEEQNNGKQRPLEFKSYRITFKGKSVTMAWMRIDPDGVGGVAAAESKSTSCTFTVNSAKRPKEMKITGHNLKIQAIYKLEIDRITKKDRLTIVHFGKPEDARPKGFEPAKGDDQVLVVRILERQKKGLPLAPPDETGDPPPANPKGGGAGVAAPPKTDKELLQGDWAMVSYETAGKVDPDAVKQGVRLTIEGDRFTLRPKLALHFAHGTFTLDRGKQPKSIDFMQKYGLPQEKPVLVPGIYELDGRTMKICRATSGDKRPTEFTTKPHSGMELFIFRRPIGHLPRPIGDGAKTPGTTSLADTAPGGSPPGPGSTNNTPIPQRTVVERDIRDRLGLVLRGEMRGGTGDVTSGGGVELIHVLRVSEVLRDSLAAKAGIVNDDIILAVNSATSLNVERFWLEVSRSDAKRVSGKPQELGLSIERGERKFSVGIRLELLQAKQAADKAPGSGNDKTKADSNQPPAPIATGFPGTPSGLGFPTNGGQPAASNVRVDDTALKQLQGKWVLVKTESKGKGQPAGKNPFVQVIDGRKVTLLKGEDVIWEGEFILVDSKSKPARYDLKITSKRRLTDSPYYGIYELSGDELKTRSSASDVKFYPDTAAVVRPKSLDTKDSSNATFFWKRQKQPE